MLTRLDPEYKFIDGPGYVVGNYPYATEGDNIHVYIPSMMTEIDNGLLEEESIERVAEPTIFLNKNHPITSATVRTVNYITGKVTDNLIVRKANALLYKKTTGKNYITHIPRRVEFAAGDAVDVKSDLGTFKDVKLY